MVGLPEGEWLGEACGSDSGFYPAAWKLSVVGKKLVSMQPLQQPDIQLDALSPSNLIDQHGVVNLHGRGFGCNGSVLITYSNPVNRCGYAQPVEYDHDIIRVSDFITRSDTLLRFNLPELSADRTVNKHIASLRYQRGNHVSQSIAVGERVLPQLAPDNPTCVAQQPVATVPSVQVFSGSNGQPVVAGVSAAATTQTSSSATGAGNQALGAQDVAVETVITPPLNKGFSKTIKKALILPGGRG